MSDKKKERFMTDGEKNKQYQNAEKEKELNTYTDKQNGGKNCDKNCK